MHFFQHSFDETRRLGFNQKTTLSLSSSNTDSSDENSFYSRDFQTRLSKEKEISDDNEMMNEMTNKMRSMKVKELKEELSKLNISTKDVFEKEELVQRLWNAAPRKQGNLQQTQVSTTAFIMGKGDDTNNYCHDDYNRKDEDIIEAQLYFTSLDPNLNIAAVNLRDSGGITVSPGDKPFATVEMIIVNSVRGGTFSSSPNQNSKNSLRLLLDTACSGLVLQPSVVERFDLPKLSTPITMTRASGGTDNTRPGLTQIRKLQLAGSTSKKLFGPMPAAVQDIGALPSALDGIIGLSFLHQFRMVDLDFCNGKLILYPKENNKSGYKDSGLDKPPLAETNIQLVARGSLEILPQLGIYTVNVSLGTRGPVKMLVDSGASSTLLNWKGVEDLGIISKTTTTSGGGVVTTTSSVLQRLEHPMGAMGSDNIAMELTHRLYVTSTLNLVHQGNNENSRSSTLQGLSLQEPKRRLGIDIGNIGILDSLKGQHVGGILGMDSLMRSSYVRIIFDPNRKKELLLYDTIDESL